ncbi:MAG: C26 family cysteine hydrolase domain-containing family [Acidimicrobiaceae bacterium]|nr:C26 family cysteine hydrolase domain-containing family [Acidimicrobiaceae bacterium]
MKTVGISQRQLPATATGELRWGLDQRWSNFLWELGILAVPLANVPHIALSVAEHLNLDGVILSGGDDLSDYGGDSAQRDETERQLFRWAFESGLPILGVCRGMQLIASTLGCALHEVDGHVARVHRIEGPLAVGEVTCYHRWAVSNVGSDLIALGWSDSVIEAMSTRNGQVLGVMWHPEREWPDNPRAAQLVQDHFGGTR